MISNLLAQWSWPEVRHHPWRTATAVLAIALGVALAFSVHLVNNSALTEFGAAVRSASGSADFELRAQADGFDEAIYSRVLAHPDVAAASPLIEIDARAPIELGGTTLIEVPGAGKVTGSVVWTQGRTAGVRFERALGSHVAVALGLEQPKPLEPEPEPEGSQPAGGILRHWFRRLAGVFS